MANLEEIYRKIEDEKNRKLLEEKIQEQNLLNEYERQRQFMMNDRKMYEFLSITSSSAAGGGGGGHKKTEIPDYFTIQVNPQEDGDSIGFYIESPSVVTYDWGDGTVDDTGLHTYSTAGTYNIKISPIIVTWIQLVSMSDGSYSGPKFSEFRYLTELTALMIIANASTFEDGALDNCQKLEIFGIKFGGPSQLKKSIFNNLVSLTDFVVIYGNTITSFESGVFEGTSIEQIYIDVTPFDSTTLVDNFLIDLDNSTLPNLNHITLYTHRTTNSDLAVESLENKGVTVDVICD